VPIFQRGQTKGISRNFRVNIRKDLHLCESKLERSTINGRREKGNLCCCANASKFSVGTGVLEEVFEIIFEQAVLVRTRHAYFEGERMTNMKVFGDFQEPKKID
jgi:hypothetical protein